jgi:hypothetical protein
MSDENDSESISFVGYRNAAPVPVAIDFGERVFLVEMFGKSDVTFITVNATDERKAIAAAIEQMVAENRNPYKFDACRVTELEVITDDDTQLEAGPWPSA